MNMKDYIQVADNVLMQTYSRYQILLDKGEGVYLYDYDGKKYLDFGAGIAVYALGYGNKEFNNKIKEQIDKLLHTSNYYYNKPAIDSAIKFLKASGMDRIFFTNSGTEAMEGAIKLARKYYYKKNLSTDSEIIAMNHSFHGRSLGALSVTGNAKYREAYQSLIGGVVFAKFNNFESVLSLVNDKTCAIVLEPIQGEGGIYPATKEFLSQLRGICNEKDILLIFDEIQCGMGRTGSMFAYQNYNIKPDILTSAKALGCGVPVGAFVAIESVASAFEPGDHGSTYGGNPFATSAVDVVFDLFEKEDILANVKKVTPYLEQKLDELVDRYDFVLERRGTGFMQGLELGLPVKGFIQMAMDKGLILFAAGSNIIRFVPPLVINKEHVDEMFHILDSCLIEYKM